MPDMSSFIQLVTQDTAPALPTSNIPIFWWKSSNGQLFISYNDGDSTQWVAVTPAPIAAIQYDIAQNLTTTQQQQAQQNLGLPAILFRSYLAGLTISMTGSGQGVFTVAPGVAADSTNVAMMALNASMQKSTLAWSAGNGGGGMDTGTCVLNTWYHVHLIRNPSTLAVDVLFSLSATAPTLPSGYTQFRRIGSLATDGSVKWFYYHQNGDEILYDVPIASISNVATAALTPALFSLSAPQGVTVWMLFRMYLAGASGQYALVQSSDEASQQVNVPPGNINIGLCSASGAYTEQMQMRSSTAQIRVSTSVATSIYVVINGYIDRRGRDA
jgi:hypothetical protein